MDVPLFEQILIEFNSVRELDLTCAKTLIPKDLDKVLRISQTLPDLRILRFGSLNESQLPLRMEKFFQEISEMKKLHTITIQGIIFLPQMDLDARFKLMFKPLNNLKLLTLLNLGETSVDECFLESENFYEGLLSFESAGNDKYIQQNYVAKIKKLEKEVRKLKSQNNKLDDRIGEIEKKMKNEK